MSAPEAGRGQTLSRWRVKNRLQTSYEFDSNIRETPAADDSVGRIEDSSARVLFQSHAVRSSPKTRLSLIFRTGLQGYAQNSIENKLINEFEITTAAKFGKFAAGVRGFGRLKLYLNDILDYSSGYAEVYLETPLFSKISSELAVQAAGVDYQNFDIFDYSENQIKWRFSRKFTPRLGGSFELAYRNIRYDRTLNFNPNEPNFGLKQKDDNYRLYLQLNYTKNFLLNFTYTFQRNNSNTLGFGYARHQLILMLGTPLFSGIWLRGYAAYQNKRYTDELTPMFPVDIDTERDESNFFIADISKDLSPGLTTLVRVAYFNNESIIRSRFYRKFLLTAGFDFRF